MSALEFDRLPPVSLPDPEGVPPAIDPPVLRDESEDAVRWTGGMFSLPPPYLGHDASCFGSSASTTDGEEDAGRPDLSNWAGDEDDVWSNVMDDDRGGRSAYPSENRRFFSVCRLFWN